MQNIVIGGSKFDTLSQKELNKFLDYAVSQGVYHIDTSPFYGSSEKMIGFYQKMNPQLIISTKVGLPRLYDDIWTSTEIQAQFQQSLNNLNVSKIETLFFHSIPSKLLNSDVFEITDRFLKSNYIKRPLANAVFSKSLSMLFKSKIKKLLLRNVNLYPNSYPSRYRQIFGEPKFFNDDLTRFIQFLLYFQPQSKYVFGVRSRSHLKEIIETHKRVNEQIIPELDEYLVKVNELSQSLKWRAFS